MQPGPVGLIHAEVRPHDVGEATPADELLEGRQRLGLEVDGDEFPGLGQDREERGAATFGDSQLEDRAAGEAPAQLAVLLDESERLHDEESVRGRFGRILADELDALDGEGVARPDRLDHVLAEGVVEEREVVRQAVVHGARTVASVSACLEIGERGGIVEYVMVPVPEEHAEAVMNYLRWNVGKPPPIPFDEASIARMYDLADDLSRALLSVVSSATVTDRELTVAEASDMIGCSDRETVGLTVELNHLTQVEGGPPFVVMLKETPPPAGEARPWATRAIMMADNVARLFRQAEQAQQVNQPLSRGFIRSQPARRTSGFERGEELAHDALRVRLGEARCRRAAAASGR